METPGWLAQRGGVLKLGNDRKTWFVIFTGQPHYALEAVPAGNRPGCAVRQTVSGQRVPANATFASADEALRGGLENLRQHLGWA